MYYLRKEPHEAVIPEIIKTDGSVIPERKYMTDDRAIYKHREFSRFYRKSFLGIAGKHQSMALYQCKTLKKILQLRKGMFDYSGEWFDVYDENGKVDISDTVTSEDGVYPEEEE